MNLKTRTVMQISEHFTVDECLRSSTATRLNITNKPGTEQSINLVRSAMLMDEVRCLLGKPVYVNSWFRCGLLNKVIGGARKSAHINGLAIDFVCPDYGSVAKAFAKIKASNIRYDKLILEFGRWIHIQRPEIGKPARRINLIAEKVNGKTQYRTVK